MIDSIIQGILNFIISVSNTVLSPIDNYLLQNFPAVAQLISYVVTFFNYILDFVRWACSTIGLDYNLLSLIFGYLEFKITVSWLFSGIKRVIKIFRSFRL